MNRSRVDYLVGGLRITLDPVNTAPGPRTHILATSRALGNLGYDVRLILASAMPFLGRFSRMRPTAVANYSRRRLALGDAVRLVSGAWAGLIVFLRSATGPRPAFIYERASVMSSLSSFHAWKRRVPRVLEVNGILSRETARDRMALRFEGVARRLEQRTFRRATLIVAVSENLKLEIVEFAGVPPDKIAVVPNGIDEDLARGATGGNGEPQEPVVGFVGALSAWQRLDKLIYAARDLPDARLEIIGDGLERESLERRVRELGLQDRVRLFGRMRQTEALERMRGWQIGFAGHERSTSSRMYHSPLKLYEYAALGLDVVASESQDAHALRSSGLRVELFGDQRTIEEALAAALALPRRTESERERLRETLVQQHGWTARTRIILERLQM